MPHFPWELAENRRMNIGLDYQIITFLLNNGCSFLFQRELDLVGRQELAFIFVYVQEVVRLLVGEMLYKLLGALLLHPFWGTRLFFGAVWRWGCRRWRNGGVHSDTFLMAAVTSELLWHEGGAVVVRRIEHLVLGARSVLFLVNRKVALYLAVQIYVWRNDLIVLCKSVSWMHGTDLYSLLGKFILHWLSCSAILRSLDIPWTLLFLKCLLFLIHFLFRG